MAVPALSVEGGREEKVRGFDVDFAKLLWPLVKLHYGCRDKEINC